MQKRPQTCPKYIQPPQKKKMCPQIQNQNQLIVQEMAQSVNNAADTAHMNQGTGYTVLMKKRDARLLF